MKAYLVHIENSLAPFDKPASEISLHRESIRARLVRQLKRMKFEVVSLSSKEEVAGIILNAESILLNDNVMLSDGFISTFLSQLPNMKANYQVVMDQSLTPLLVEEKAQPQWRSVAIYYIGESAKFEDLTFDELNVSKQSLYSLAHGLPARMSNLENINLHFESDFAYQLEHWFDLQTAASLYAREFVSKTVGLARKYLPKFLVDLVLRWQWLMERTNVIGKNCKIHHTAIIEGCVIGDNVQIGPHTYLQASVISDGAVLREKTTSKMSYIGPETFILGTDIVNAYIGARSSVIAPMMYNVVVGENAFISGGTGFADFTAGQGKVTTTINGSDIDSGLDQLGSCVGDDSFVGANMIFAPGRVIPNGSQFLDNGLIKDVPSDSNGTFVLSGNKFLQIPNNFIGANKA